MDNALKQLKNVISKCLSISGLVSILNLCINLQT